MVHKSVSAGLSRAAINKQLVGLLARVAYLAVLTAGLFAALGLIGLDKTVTSLLAGLGILGLALGFAFQDIVANFMAGILLASRQPFAIGDWISVAGSEGIVEDLSLRATVLRAFTGEQVILPNHSVLGGSIVNYSESNDRRVDIPVGVGYDDDLEKARETARDVLINLSLRDSEKPADVFLTGFGGSSIDMVCRFWIDQSQHNFMEARSNAIQALSAALTEAGIEIPYPIRDLRLPPSESAEKISHAPSS